MQLRPFFSPSNRENAEWQKKGGGNKEQNGGECLKRPFPDFYLLSLGRPFWQLPVFLAGPRRPHVRPDSGKWKEWERKQVNRRKYKSIIPWLCGRSRIPVWVCIHYRKVIERPAFEVSCAFVTFNIWHLPQKGEEIRVKAPPPKFPFEPVIIILKKKKKKKFGILWYRYYCIWIVSAA